MTTSRKTRSGVAVNWTLMAFQVSTVCWSVECQLDVWKAQILCISYRYLARRDTVAMPPSPSSDSMR